MYWHFYYKIWNQTLEIGYILIYIGYDFQESQRFVIKIKTPMNSFQTICLKIKEIMVPSNNEERLINKMLENQAFWKEWTLLRHRLTMDASQNSSIYWSVRWFLWNSWENIKNYIYINYNHKSHFSIEKKMPVSGGGKRI